MVPRVAALALVLAGCCAPNNCATARLGFTALDPLTSALEQGPMPDRLADLFPGGLPAGLEAEGSELAFRDANGRAVPLAWHPDLGELSFRYERPGMNVCTWRVEAPVWTCRGWY